MSYHQLFGYLEDYWKDGMLSLSLYLPAFRKSVFPNIFIFPGGSVAMIPPATQGMQVLSLGWERSPGEGNGNPLQYSCQGNPMDRGAWWATVQGVTKSWIRMNDWHFFHFHMKYISMLIWKSCWNMWFLRKPEWFHLGKNGKLWLYQQEGRTLSY